MTGTEMAVYGLIAVGAGMLSRLPFGRKKPEPPPTLLMDTFLIDFSTGLMHQTGSGVSETAAKMLESLGTGGNFMVLAAPHGKYKNGEHWPTVKNRK